jgi:nitrite reductase/ring-hydroxylating ferredoxin subunit
MSDKRDDSPCASCGDRPVGSSRRAFLQLAACVTISAAALGLSATDAEALAVSFVEGTPAGSERRYPIPAADGVTIDKVSQVIVVRYQAHLYAFNLACPHQNQMLRWLPKESRFQCPKHESKYQPTGVFMNGRATRNMDRLGVRVEGAELLVNVDTMFKSDQDPSGWAAATAAI